MKTDELGPQQYVLILMDLATIAAAQANGVGEPVDATSYVPGTIRNYWIDYKGDPALRQRVTALANAGSSSLTKLPGDQLVTIAERYGLPLTLVDADSIAEYFQNKRDAVLLYNR